MRNLKRVLSLALALVMVLGMMVITTSAATYTDADEITYEEAIAVVSGVGLYEGYDDGSLKPTEILTREQAATIVARIMLGDIAETLKPTQQIFDDVATTRWSAAAIEYCYNIGMIDGLGNGNFDPTGELTGTAFAKLLLVALGYDAAAEGYTGADWKKNINADALAENLYVEDVNIAAACTREVAAQMVLQVLEQDVVDYVTSYDYATGANVVTGPWPTTKTFAETYYPTLVKTEDGLDGVWGRPYDYAWKYGKATLWVEWTVADATYTTATTECQISSDIGLKTPATFTMYTNGIVNASAYTVQPTDTVQRIGAQGTLVEVYADYGIIVAIDTFLAKVEKVTPVTKDAAGHKISNASIELTVYNSATGTTVKQYSTTNYTYTKGDMVLVNLYTNNTVAYGTGVVTVNAPALTSGVANYMEILGVAQTAVGAQTYHWFQADKHTIEGVEYPNAKWLKLDEAVYNVVKYNWFFDQYGNVIGSTEIATTYSYGIIEQIQWINPIGAAGYAAATIRYIDGTTTDAVIASVDGTTLVYAQDGFGATTNVSFPYVSTNISNNFANLVADDLYRISVNPNGTLALNHVFTDADADGVLDDGEKDHIAGAAINPYGTVNALSAIGNGTDYVYANANTVFLVRTEVKRGPAVVGYTYDVVTGYQNMPKYTAANVDYVYADNADSYVDFVYVTGTPASAAPYFGVFYLNTTAGIQGVLNAQGTAYDYYVVSGILDGVAGVYKVAGDATFYVGGTTVTLDNFKAIANELCYVQVTEDEITQIWDTVADNDNLNYHTGAIAYTGLYLDVHAATTTANTVTKNGDVLCVAGAYYNVGGLTPVVGEWADDLSAKNVYVIYDSTKTVAGAYVAKAVYVVTPNASDIESGVEAPEFTVDGAAVAVKGSIIYVDQTLTTDEKAVAIGAYLTTNGYTDVSVASDLSSITAKKGGVDWIFTVASFEITMNTAVNSPLFAGVTVAKGIGFEFTATSNVAIAAEELTVALYDGDVALAEAVYVKADIAAGSVTRGGTFYTDNTASSSWDGNYYTASANVVPDTVKLFLNGVLYAEGSVN